MKLKTMLCTTMMFAVLTATQAFAAPGIFNLIIDGSASVSEADFQKAKDAAALFIAKLEERADDRPGELCDWVSINFFGDDDDYKGTRFVNCSHSSEVQGITRNVDGFPHPEYSNTAIYTAIGRGTVETLQHSQKKMRELGLSSSPYSNNIILITDGKDSSSNTRLKEFVRQTFPTGAINLFIIAVGSNSDVDEFANTADLVLEIDNFELLPDAIITVLNHA